MSEPVTITIIGAGAWGTALACVCARNGHVTRLWGRDSAVIEAVSERRGNPRYLPGITLPENIQATTELDRALDRTGVVLLVTPAQTVGTMAVEMASQLDTGTPIVLCAKGINRESGKLPAQTVQDCLPGNPVAALSGPSFATDVARNLPTAVTLAADEPALARQLARTISGPSFRVYASGDLTGVELGGALKNVIALAVGVCRGMELGASAEAALIARGFAELTRLAVALGANPETLMGLSGLGDLVLTCSSPQSRNFAFGMALGSHGSASSIPRDMPLAEGALTASVAARLAGEHRIETPVIDKVASLVDGDITAGEALDALLSRPLKSEQE